MCQKDSARHRKAKGIIVGGVPFGTVRSNESGRKGILERSPLGVWLMPDGTTQEGHRDEPPVEGAAFRGYFEAVERIYQLYKTGRYGRRKLAETVNNEGFWFRDAKGCPVKFDQENIRAITGNWPEYGGLVLEKASKKRHVREFSLDELRFSEEHAVMPLDLLYSVAKVQYERSGKPRDHGVRRNFRIYALNGMTYCAHCERRAIDLDNPGLRSRLQGRVGRYAHKEGVQCGCTNRSVLATEYEAEFGRLIKLLSIRPDALPLMTELAIQADRLRQGGAEIDPEVEKREAIALCKRRIDAAVHLYGDGRITRDEYLRRVELNEREIAHWEARATESERAALELAMCMDVLEKLSRLWDTGEPEDRQGMARSLFSHVVFDLDTRRITDFRLKPWADRFLVLRAAMYEGELEENIANHGSSSGLEPVSREVLPEGSSVQAVRWLSPQDAESLVLQCTQRNPSTRKMVSRNHLSKAERNTEIIRRYHEAGGTAALAREFGVSEQRIRHIIQRFR